MQDCWNTFKFKILSTIYQIRSDQSLTLVRLFVTPLTVTHQTLSLKYSRQEYWSRPSFPPPGYFPDSGIKLAFPVSPALAGRFFTTELPGKPNQSLTKEFITTKPIL